MSTDGEHMATPAKNERFEVRCTQEQRFMIDRAVELSGRSLTDFVLGAVQEAALSTIREFREFETIDLNARDSRRLAEALLNPPEPNARLRAAADRYRRVVAEKESRRNTA